MNRLTANELRTRGVSAVEEGLKHCDDLAISVRGEHRFVVMEMERYNHLRELELAAAVDEAKAGYAAGHYITETVAEHMQRVKGNG